MRNEGTLAQESLKGEALLDSSGRVWLPFDAYQPGTNPQTWARLSSKLQVRHANRCAFAWKGPFNHAVHIINGMGVTLGDSIIGFNAMVWLKRCHPGLHVCVYRSPNAPAYVERLYEIAKHVVDEVRYLPRSLQNIPSEAIDLSDFLHWPGFAVEPMVDFFMRSLGISPGTVPAAAKSNRWLSDLPLPELPTAWRGRNYVLICDRASTPLRSVPPAYAAELVEMLWSRYRLPIVGFHPIQHPEYRDVTAQSQGLDQYMAWVKDASALFAVDSSAIHIAAGFDVPTLAVFSSVDPLLRIRDYTQCQYIDMRTPSTSGLHESEDADVLHAVDQSWRALLDGGELQWRSTLDRH
jgi:ADP-heptose:LPS heptosyltransferase